MAHGEEVGVNSSGPAKHPDFSIGLDTGLPPLCSFSRERPGVAYRPSRPLRSCRLVHEVKIISIIILRHRLSSSLFLTFAKATVGKPAGI